MKIKVRLFKQITMIVIKKFTANNSNDQLVESILKS